MEDVMNWICARKQNPEKSGTYRVSLFTGVERDAYWNADRQCWQQNENPANKRNVHRGIQRVMFSYNSFWRELNA
jgi:hypothetical protein